ncbi:hypothetical protein [Mycobacterium colombiense]|uniref:hypothetical protein n=1 Tax=Mycobacterium colombiense TaxID=339268 RepID=UPI0012DB3A3A|nr:hypothetical protein [Mycobacterium colombiense]
MTNPYISDRREFYPDYPIDDLEAVVDAARRNRPPKDITRDSSESLPSIPTGPATVEFAEYLFEAQDKDRVVPICATTVKHQAWIAPAITKETLAKRMENR